VSVRAPNANRLERSRYGLHFLRLLEAAGRVEALEGEGPFTVFALVEEAFGQLPPGVLEWLLGEETGSRSKR
jgi:uncharacterized surface protein with fasciclin (FAS1) repeats